jgi:hypothetical protein
VVVLTLRPYHKTLLIFIASLPISNSSSWEGYKVEGSTGDVKGRRNKGIASAIITIFIIIALILSGPVSAVHVAISDIPDTKIGDHRRY